MRRSGLIITTLAAIAALLACSEGELPTEAGLSPGAALFGVADFEAPTGAFYGPETFVRKRGRPVSEERTVDLDGYGAPYTLHVRNGDADGGHRVLSGELYVDGERILGPSDFSPRTSGFVIPVEASGSLGLSVELRGGPGSELTVWVEGTPLPASVAVTPESATFTSLGETTTLSAAVFGPQGEPLDDPVTWSSSDAAVATVDDAGVVTAVANGEAAITATAGDAAGSAAVTVEVEEAPADWFAGVDLSATTIVIDGGLVSYTVTLTNPTGETQSGIVVQARAEQDGGTSKPAGGHSVFCGPDHGVGVLPPDGCTDDMTLNVSNSSPHGSGTLVPGPATIRFALQQGSTVLDEHTVDVTLVAEEPEPDATTSTVEVSDDELTADGHSTATATVSLADADGVPIGTGGHEVSFEITPINENTPGATIGEVIDNGDGTYTATIVPPVNNGTGLLIATIPSSDAPAAAPSGMALSTTSSVDTVGTAELTYSGGNEVPVMEPLVISTPEDEVTEVVLPGSDPDGDPLTWHIESRYFRNGFSSDTRYTDASGDTIIPSGLAGWQPLDLTLTDNTLYYHPQPDGFSGGLAMLLVSVSDGLGTSASDTVRIDVFSVNDAPRVTLEGDLVLYEDTHLDFAMRGDDPEMDRFNVKIVVPPLPRGFLVHHHFTGDVIISGQTTLQSSSDQSAGWPMTFTPTANDFDDVYYNEFSYVLEEVNTGLRSPEARINIRVLPVNDAPVLDIDGIGTAQDHDLAATLIAGVAYTVPALGVDDEEVVNSGGVSGEGEFDVTIEMVGAGRIYLPDAVKQDYEDAWVVFEETNESVTFSMPYDVTDQGFVSGLTIDRLISSLVYLPRSAGTETLTITIGDGGVGGSCEPGPMTDDYYDASPGADLDQIPGPCVKTSVTTIQIDVEDVEEGGTRPEDGTVMPLTQGGA